MSSITVSHPTRKLYGTVALDGSKSISNRALIALALSGGKASDCLSRLSTSRDTVTLQKLLSQTGDVFDAGDAGTTFRFMAAYLAIQPGEKTLTGSPRMLERPCGPLVEGLRRLGADISYLGKDGYPPLLIGEGSFGHVQEVSVPANVSSQFLSALLLIAPYLPDGLTLRPDGPLVSRPYLEMTLSLMRYFGAEAHWQNEAIVVHPGKYIPQPLAVEADWSGASYWYALAALAEEVHLRLEGLFETSWQGDAALVKMMRHFGVQTAFEENAVVLTKMPVVETGEFRQDFLTCPDIAQTLAVICAGAGVRGIFSGLETLSIKETDRIAALQTELSKIGVRFDAMNSGKEYAVQGRAAWTASPHFATYGDHRMAMAFAALGILGTVEIEDPEVVGKSYPKFWEDLEKVGFEIRY